MFRKMRKLFRDPLSFLLDSKIGILRVAGEKALQRQRLEFLRAGEAAAGKKVTVIMTAYNTGHLVEDAVRSVLAQSHANLELHVIDDASTDDTCAILAKLAHEDVRLKVFSSARNHGTYWSKNWCLKKTDAEFVAFHDSDDVSHPDRIRMQLGALMARPNVLMTTCRWHRVDENGTALNVDGKPDRMAAISLMIRRQPVLEKIGFFDSVRIAADTEFLHRATKLCGQGAHLRLRHILYTGLLRDGSLTTGEGSGFSWTENSGNFTRTVQGNRADYYESFTAWHMLLKRNMKASANFILPFPMRERAFDAPDAICRGCDDQDMTCVNELNG